MLNLVTWLLNQLTDWCLEKRRRRLALPGQDNADVHVPNLWSRGSDAPQELVEVFQACLRTIFGMLVSSNVQ